MIEIRKATATDVPALTAIYNQGIADRIATLEKEQRSEEERAAWLSARDQRTPVLVAVRAGEVVGWASINVFNPRAAYRFVADFSIYVARDARGSGIGGALLDSVIAEARTIGYHKLVLAGFPFNTAGVALYRSRGFREVGIYKEQGVLDGRWVDTIVMELLLNSDPPPA